MYHRIARCVCPVSTHSAALGNGIKQVHFHTVDELAEAAEHYDSEGWDIYFVMSNFKEEGTRRGEDAKHIKSFFLDLDCGEDKVAKGGGLLRRGTQYVDCKSSALRSNYQNLLLLTLGEAYMFTGSWKNPYQLSSGKS